MERLDVGNRHLASLGFRTETRVWDSFVLSLQQTTKNMEPSGQPKGVGDV